LSETALRGANLVDGVHLEGASPFGAHLEGASLVNARLEGANLFDAHLERVYLGAAQGDAKTRLPDGVERPAHWPAYEPD
jgi:uncharacterized protein YjbI with pentapeptide repeats